MGLLIFEHGLPNFYVIMNLTTYLAEMGLNRNQLANWLGVNRSTVAGWTDIPEKYHSKLELPTGTEWFSGSAVPDHVRFQVPWWKGRYSNGMVKRILPEEWEKWLQVAYREDS